ncbi:MAG: 5'-nucleotidase C-terminal domain-containing protein [Ilumatobacteraceae bacterium]
MGSPRSRRWGSVSAVAVVAALAGVYAPANAAPSVAGPGQVDLTLLNINDFHGRIDSNTVRFAGTIEAQRAAAGEANTVLLSAGDNIGATLFASAVQNDQPTIDVLNALDVQASAVGNHEMDQGFADLTDRVIGGTNPVEFPYLAANIYDSNGDTVLPEFTVLGVAGETVAIIGVITEETPGLVSPAGIAGLTFGDPVAAVNRVATQLSDGDLANGEADIIVAEYHEGAGAGVPDGSSFAAEIANGSAFARIATQTSGEVDVIFTGHTHKVYAWDGPVPGDPTRTRPILQTGSYGENIGKVVLTVDTTTHTVAAYTAGNVARTTTPDATLIATYPRVAAVKPIVDAALAYSASVGNTPVGSVGADITTAFSGGSYVNGVYTGGGRDDRSKESTLGDLVADSMVSVLSDPLRGGATIGVVNPGGLRNELYYAPDGTITYAEANNVLPFVNNLWTVTLTGAQFKTLLEQQWQRDGNGNVPSRPYLQLGLSSNVTYTFDATLAEGSRITSITVDGQPIDPAGQYRVGTFSFLATGGDNIHVFKQSTNVRDSGLIDRDAWIAYITGNSPLQPNFARQAVAVSGLPTGASIGQQLTFGVTGLDLTSLGSPQNTSLAISLGGVAIGTATVLNGAATIDVIVPPGTLTGAQQLQLVAAPSGTTVTIPVTVVDTRVRATTTLVTTRTTQRFGGPRVARLTASVSLSDGSTPTGTVDILQDDVVVATLPLTNGSASYTLPAATPAGVHQYTARYADSNTIAGSTSAPRTVTVTKASSFTILTANKLVVKRGQQGPRLTAYVLLDSPAAATGTVTFVLDGTAIATVPVVNGMAVLQLGALPVGSHLVRATYSGAASINGSVSNPLPLLVRRS